MDLGDSLQAVPGCLKFDDRVELDLPAQVGDILIGGEIDVHVSAEVRLRAERATGGGDLGPFDAVVDPSPQRLIDLGLKFVADREDVLGLAADVQPRVGVDREEHRLRRIDDAGVTAEQSVHAWVHDDVSLAAGRPVHVVVELGESETRGNRRLHIRVDDSDRSLPIGQFEFAGGGLVAVSDGVGDRPGVPLPVAGPPSLVL